jgi:glycosyltransferase involved in cell wall biosynthesis
VSADQFVVLLVSRLERWKGVHVAVEGAAEILARHPEVLFVRIGPAHALDAGYATELMGAVSEAHLRPHWQWVGPLPPTEIPRWLQAADVFLHPNVGPEPFGMAVVEAMAAGLPVVASGLGGPAEVIRDGVDGILVPPGDPAALARGIVDLLDKPAERARLGRAAQARAAAFSADAYPERLLQALVALAPSLLGTSAPPGESGSRPEPTA